MKHAHIVGWGAYSPERVLTNDEIANWVDTNDEWIRARTGIHERRIAGAKETTATLAFEAAARALSVARLAPSQLDMVIVATSTPEHVFPSTACRVQDYLGAKRAGAFDLSAACTGFIYALSMASNAIATGQIETALVIGAETLSRVVDWHDRATCIIFGDGAGALVLKGSDVPGGVLASVLRSDGSGGNLLSLRGVEHMPVPTLPPNYYANGHDSRAIQMQGRQVFRFATRVVGEVIAEVLEKADLIPDDVQLVVPHQANGRIISSAAKRLGMPEERFFMNLDRMGNTSAASIPLALVDAIRQGRLRPNDNVVFVGFGGGLTWGASVIKWDVLPVPDERTWQQTQWRKARYVWARLRSRLRRFGRQVGARIAGSHIPEASLKDADRRPPDP